MDTKAVVEMLKGNMPKAEGSKAPEAEDKTPESQSTVSPEEKVYTQAQVESLIQSAKSAVGRDVSTLKTENETLKKQLSTKDRELSTVQEDITELQKEIGEMSKNDPDKKAYLDKLNSLKAKERQIKADQLGIEAERNALGESKAKVQEAERNIAMWEVFNEYQDGDFTRLQTLCNNLGLNNKEHIKVVADTLGWSHKQSHSAEPEKQTMKVLSGQNQGGKGALTAKDIKGMGPDGLMKNYKEIAKMPLTI